MKLKTLVAAFIILTFMVAPTLWGANVTTRNYSIPGDAKYVTTEAELNSANTAGIADIIIASSFALTSSFTSSATTTIHYTCGAITTTTGYTLTYSTPPVFDGLCQAFTGTGTVILPEGMVQYLEIYGGKGDDSTDNTSMWTKAMAAQTRPIVKLVGGTYRGIVDTATKNATITGSDGNFLGTTMYNNSVSSPLISIGSSSGVNINNLHLNNANVPAHTIYGIGATYLQLDKLFIRRHGNNTTNNKWGVYLHSCTFASIGTLNFADTHEEDGSQSIYGGHFYMSVTNGPKVDLLTAGHAGSDSTATAFYLQELNGGSIGAIEIDSGGGGGILFARLLYSFTIGNIYTELTTEAVCLAESWIQLKDNISLNITGMRLYHHADTSGSVKPLIGLRNNNALVLNNIFFWRTINNSAIPILQYFDANNKNIKISDIHGGNYTNHDQTVGLAYTFFDTNNQLSSNIIFENYHDRSVGMATHNLLNVDGLITNNIQGIQIFGGNSGIIVNNPGTYPLSADDPISCRGINCLFSDVVIYDAVNTIGATSVIPLDLPTNTVILGVVLRVNTAITGATSWSAAFSGGDTTSIGSGYSIDKNTKVYKMFGTPPVTTTAVGGTDITLTAAGGNFSAGNIGVDIYVRTVGVIADAP